MSYSQTIAWGDLQQIYYGSALPPNAVVGSIFINTSSPTTANMSILTLNNGWIQIGGSGGGGGSPHPLLDASQNNDTEAVTPVRGMLIRGDSSSKWGSLSIGSANSVLQTDGTDPFWSATLTAKARIGVLTSNVLIGTRRGINFNVPSDGTTWLSDAIDNSGLEQVDLTFNARTRVTTANTLVGTESEINFIDDVQGTDSGGIITLTIRPDWSHIQNKPTQFASIPHALLDGLYDSDTIAHTPTTGDIVAALVSGGVPSGGASSRLQNITRGTTTTSTMSITLGYTAVVGNSLIAMIGGPNFNSVIVSSISQTNVTWTKQYSHLYGEADIEVWLGTILGNAGTNITITLSDTPTTTGFIADIGYYSGILVMNTSSTAEGAGTSGSTGSVTTTFTANEVIIGGVITGATSSAVGQTVPTGGFSLQDGADTVTGGQHYSLSFLERIVSSLGTYGSGTTIANTISWAGAIVAFYVVSGTSEWTGLGIGKTNQILTVNSGIPAWANPQKWIGLMLMGG